MAVRIKSHWHNEESGRSLGEIAGALAFIAWRLALDRAITLHGERFVYDDDRQRLGVIAEYLYFLIQISDRLTHGRLDEAERRELVTALALKLADHYQDNAGDLLGDADHRAAFIDGLNRRAADYAEYGFGEAGPSYPFLRQLGFAIQQIMGESQENRWVIDQVMDKDGPEVYSQFKRALRDLFD